MQSVNTAVERNIDPYIELPGFISIKVRSLFPGATLPCDFFFPSIFEGESSIQADKVLVRGELYTTEDCQTLQGDGVETLYIDPNDSDVFLNYFSTQTQEAINSQEVQSEKKTQLLFDNAEAVVKKVFREHPTESSVLLGKQIVENLAHQLTSEEISVKSLLSLFSKDYYTFSHCVQVSTLGMAFCNFLGWNKSEIEDIGIGTLFHDLGKNQIDDDILNKPGKLDSREFELIKQHPFTGYQQLKKIKALTKEQLDAVLYHHEAVNGSGYPDGLTGNEIPRYARLVHIVDVFDALTAERVYKQALSREDALMLMSGEMLWSFDAELLSAFRKFIEDPGLSDGDDRESEIKAGIGTPVLLQLESSGPKIKSILVGMELDQYIILRLPDSTQSYRLRTGMPLIVRYLYAGDAYGFEGSILEVIKNPPLILSAYPRKIEKLSLRAEQRQECFLPAVVEVGRKKSRCVVLDLSYRGCKISLKNGGKGELPSDLINEAVQVSAHLPGRNEAVCLRGKIKNLEKTDEGIRMGIQFAELSEQAADQWKDFIDDILELAW